MAEKAASKKKAKNAAKPNEPAKGEKTSQPTILDAKKPKADARRTVPLPKEYAVKKISSRRVKKGRTGTYLLLDHDDLAMV